MDRGREGVWGGKSVVKEETRRRRRRRQRRRRQRQRKGMRPKELREKWRWRDLMSAVSMEPLLNLK